MVQVTYIKDSDVFSYVGNKSWYVDMLIIFPSFPELLSSCFLLWQNFTKKQKNPPQNNNNNNKVKPTEQKQSNHIVYLYSTLK